MKTNKLWSIMMMLVMVFSTAILFSSCGKDDDTISPIINPSPKPTSFLVGAWSDNQGGEVIELLASGVFKYYDNYSYLTGKEDADNWTGSWKYVNSFLVITDTEMGQTYTYKVVSHTSTTIELSQDGSTITYTKLSPSK